MRNGLIRDEHTGILYKKWGCPVPCAVFLLVHGLGGYSGRWDPAADFFLQNNISSYAIELKGFGQTAERKGHIDSFAVYYRDIQSLCEIVRRENRGEKIFLIGESMGALISFLLVGLKPDLFDGVICLSPAFKSRLKFSAADTLSMYACLIFNPQKQFVMPFDGRMCTRDVAWQKVMDTDEREHRLATPKLLFTILRAAGRVDSIKHRIKIPIFFLIPGDFDVLTDSAETKRVFDGLPAEDKNIIQYPEMYHALSVDVGREKVFADIVQWVRNRIEGDSGEMHTRH